MIDHAIGKAKSHLAIVMPNRNHARFLDRSLGSIANQTRPADEVIIIDDASEDDSLALIDSHVARHASWRRIRHAERMGVVATLNQGLMESNADAICFLGADDWLAPRFLERVGSQFERHPGVGFVASCVGVCEGERLGGIRPAILPARRTSLITPEAFRILLGRADNFFPATALAYRACALRELGGFDESLGSMADSFVLRQLALRWGFVFVPHVLGRWYLQGSNESILANLDPVAMDRRIARGRAIIEREPEGVFSAGFADVFERRTRFHAARVALDQHGLSAASRAEIVASLTGLDTRGRARLEAWLRLGRLGELAALTLLTLRMRPMHIGVLVAEGLRRAMGRVPAED